MRKYERCVIHSRLYRGPSLQLVMGDAKKKFVFVKWLEDDSVTVMPTKAIKKGQKVGSVLCAGGKFYDAELMKFSGI